MTEPRPDLTAPAVSAPDEPTPPTIPTVTVPRRRRLWPPRVARAARPAPQGLSAMISTASTMVILVSVWVVLQLLVLGGVSHDRTQTLLYREFRVQLAETTAPLGPTIPVGDPVAIMTIPAIGVDEVVVEGTASGDLLAGPGHQRGTPLPGQRGFSVVMCRAATYGAPCAHLGDLSQGDAIDMVTSQGRVTLDVIGVRREGDPIPAFTNPAAAVITLVSAEGSGRLSALTPDATVYVDAVAEQAFPTPGGYGGTTPRAEQPMERDTTALPLLALWLALLVGLSTAVVLARQRFPSVVVWMVAGPFALGLAWVSTDTAMRLLPNLL